MIIDKLASNSSRDKLKPDGTTLAPWLSGTAVFAGALCRKYPHAMELAGLLQFLSNQLKGNNSLDLVVLKELVAKMSGIEVLEDMSESQLRAQAGTHWVCVKCR